MFPFGMNDDGFNSHLDGIDNINLSIFDSLKEKNKEIYEHNGINEIELRDFISKGNNDNNSTELFHDETKKISFEPFNNEKTKSNTNTKIFLNKKRNHEKISYENKNHILIKENLKEKEDLKEKENSNRGRRKKILIMMKSHYIANSKKIILYQKLRLLFSIIF